MHRSVPTSTFKIRKPSRFSAQTRGKVRQMEIDSLHNDSTKTVAWMTSLISRAKDVLKKAENEDISLQEELHSEARKRTLRQGHITNIVNIPEEYASADEGNSEESIKRDSDINVDSDGELFGDVSDTDVADKLEEASDEALVILTDSEEEQDAKSPTVEEDEIEVEVEDDYSDQLEQDDSERDEDEQIEQDEALTREPIKTYEDGQDTHYQNADDLLSSYDSDEISQEELSDAYSAGYDDYEEEPNVNNEYPAQLHVDTTTHTTTAPNLPEENHMDLGYPTIPDLSTHPQGDLRDLIQAAVQEVYNQKDRPESLASEESNDISNDDILEEDIPISYNMANFDDSQINYQNERAEKNPQPTDNNAPVYGAENGSQKVIEKSSGIEEEYSMEDEDNSEGSYENSDDNGDQLHVDVQVLSSSEEEDGSPDVEDVNLEYNEDENDLPQYTEEEAEYDHPSINATYNSGVSLHDPTQGIGSIADMLSNIPQNMMQYHNPLPDTSNDSTEAYANAHPVESMISNGSTDNLDINKSYSSNEQHLDDALSNNETVGSGLDGDGIEEIGIQGVVHPVILTSDNTDDVDHIKSDIPIQTAADDINHDTSVEHVDNDIRLENVNDTNAIEIIESSIEPASEEAPQQSGPEEVEQNNETIDDNSMYYSILQTNEDLIEDHSELLGSQTSPNMEGQYKVNISESVYESSIVSGATQNGHDTDYVSPFHSDPFVTSEATQDVQSILKATLQALANEKSVGGGKTHDDTSDEQNQDASTKEVTHILEPVSELTHHVNHDYTSKVIGIPEDLDDVTEISGVRNKDVSIIDDNALNVNLLGSQSVNGNIVQNQGVSITDEPSDMAVNVSRDQSENVENITSEGYQNIPFTEHSHDTSQIELPIPDDATKQSELGELQNRSNMHDDNPESEYSDDMVTAFELVPADQDNIHPHLEDELSNHHGNILSDVLEIDSLVNVTSNAKSDYQKKIDEIVESYNQQQSAIMMNPELNVSEVNLPNPTDYQNESLPSVASGIENSDDQNIQMSLSDSDLPIDCAMKPSLTLQERISGPTIITEASPAHLETTSDETEQEDIAMTDIYETSNIPSDIRGIPGSTLENQKEDNIGRTSTTLSTEEMNADEFVTKSQQSEGSNPDSIHHEQMQTVHTSSQNEEPLPVVEQSDISLDSDVDMVTAIQDEEGVHDNVNGSVHDEISHNIDHQPTVVTPEELNSPVFGDHISAITQPAAHSLNLEYPTPIQSGEYSDVEYVPIDSNANSPASVASHLSDDLHVEIPSVAPEGRYSTTTVPLLHSDRIVEDSSEDIRDATSRKNDMSDSSVSQTDSDVEEMLDSSDVDMINEPEKKNSTGFVRKLLSAPVNTLKYISSNITRIGSIGETFTDAMTNPPSDSDVTSASRAVSEEAEDMPILSLHSDKLPAEAKAASMQETPYNEESFPTDDKDEDNIMHCPADALIDTVDVIPESIFPVEELGNIHIEKQNSSDIAPVNDDLENVSVKNQILDEKISNTVEDASASIETKEHVTSANEVGSQSLTMDIFPLFGQRDASDGDAIANIDVEEDPVEPGNHDDASVPENKAQEELIDDTSVVEPDSLPILTRSVDELSGKSNIDMTTVEKDIYSNDIDIDNERKETKLQNISIPLLTSREAKNVIDESRVAVPHQVALEQEILEEDTGPEVQPLHKNSDNDENSAHFPSQVESVPDRPLTVDINLTDDIDMEDSDIENENPVNVEQSSIKTPIIEPNPVHILDNTPDVKSIQDIQNEIISDIPSTVNSTIDISVSNTVNEEEGVDKDDVKSNVDVLNEEPSVENLSTHIEDKMSTESLTDEEEIVNQDSIEVTSPESTSQEIDVKSTEDIAIEQDIPVQEVLAPLPTASHQQEINEEVNEQEDIHLPTVEPSTDVQTEFLNPVEESSVATETVNEASDAIDGSGVTASTNASRTTDYSGRDESVDHTNESEDIKETQVTGSVQDSYSPDHTNITGNIEVTEITNTSQTTASPEIDSTTQGKEASDEEEGNIVPENSKATEVAEETSQPSRRTRAKKPKRKARNPRKRKIAITEPESSEGVYKRTRRGQSSGVGSPKKDTPSRASRAASTKKNSSSKASATKDSSKKKSTKDDNAKQMHSRRRTRSSRKFK